MREHRLGRINLISLIFNSGGRMCTTNNILTELSDLLNDLTEMPNEEQMYKIYGRYLDDFVKTPLLIDGLKVVLNTQKVSDSKKYNNFLLRKHEAFCHIVTRGINNSRKREFDVNRANKIHWIKPILENRQDRRVRYFEGQNSENKWCRFYWYKDKNYIVLLREVSRDLLLVTGYCVDSTEVGKFQKQWESYQLQERTAKKNLPRR